MNNKWNLKEMEQMWKARRALAKDITANKKADIETEMRLRKQQLDRELEEKLREIAKEEDAYMAKYYEYCEQRRHEVNEAYKQFKEMEGGDK